MSKLQTDPVVMTAEDYDLLRQARVKFAMAEFPKGAPPFPNPQGGVLEGHRVVFTGQLPNKVTRQDAWNKVADLGGEIGTGVTKKTTLLVVGDWLEFTLRPGYSVSSKYEKALNYRDKGVPIRLLDGIEFVTTLGLEPSERKPARRRNDIDGGGLVADIMKQVVPDALRRALAEQGMDKAAIELIVADVVNEDHIDQAAAEAWATAQ